MKLPQFFLHIEKAANFAFLRHCWRYKMFKRVDLTALVLLVLATVCSAQLIGIDLGTMYTKVAMIHSGAGKAFTIVENMKSERKIETAVQSALRRFPFSTRRGITKAKLPASAFATPRTPSSTPS